MRLHLFIPLLLLLIVPVLASNATTSAQTTEESFSFVVLGHVRGQENGRLNPLIDELVNEVSELDPAMVFLTGDMIWGYIDNIPDPDRAKEVVTQDWDQLDAKLGRLGVPIYRVPGNHDISDPITRDIYFERYGKPPQAITYHGNLFILLNTSFVPEGDGPTRRYILTERLDSNQVTFIREKLSEKEPYDNIFLFMHHVLWWKEDAPWWDDVHPLLVDRNVRAVFSGDYGPVKFSHLERDGIDYVRSTIEDKFSIDREDSLLYLHASEEDRLLAQQFDNFLYITVDGPEINIEVKTIGAMSSGKFSPQRYREVHGSEKVEAKYVYDPEPETPGLAQRIWNFIGSPRRLLALGLIITVCFLGGLATGVVWSRWKAANYSLQPQTPGRIHTSIARDPGEHTN